MDLGAPILDVQTSIVLGSDVNSATQAAAPTKIIEDGVIVYGKESELLKGQGIMFEGDDAATNLVLALVIPGVMCVLIAFFAYLMYKSKQAKKEDA